MGIEAAAGAGNMEIVEMLLDRGAYRGLGVSSAAEYGHADILKLLLNKGANPHQGMWSRHPEIVKLLLDCGLEPDDEELFALSAKHGRIGIV